MKNPVQSTGRAKAEEMARNGQNLGVVETMDFCCTKCGCEKKRQREMLKMAPKVLALSHWKDGAIMNRMAASVRLSNLSVSFNLESWLCCAPCNFGQYLTF